MAAPLRLAREPALMVTLAAGAIALCIYGALTLTQGLAVPVTASLSQARLDREFDRRLAQVPVAAEEVAKLPAGSQQRQPPAATPQAGAPIARLEVGRLGIREVVLAGEATHDRMRQGPAIIRRGDAASPVTIIAAHRDTHFLFIRDLRAGDEITLQWADGKNESYRVVMFETVRWNQFAYPLDPARPLLALATCYPFGGTEYGGPWRRVAWAERID
ncbi:MAG: class D sortase [Novosphingobium sp.]